MIHPERAIIFAKGIGIGETWNIYWDEPPKNYSVN